MQDPHVVSLHYQIATPSSISYANPPSILVSQSTFTGELANGRFVAEMTQHFALESEARVPVDGFLRAWEISAAIGRGMRELTFVFERATVVDRAPPPPAGSVTAYGQLTLGALTMSGVASVHLTSPVYPQPPAQFVATPLVEMLWARFQQYVAGAEPLWGMAYFCLTILEEKAGHRDGVPKRFFVSRKVVRTLATLSTERGGALGARKADGIAVVSSGEEMAWIRKVIQVLIQHAGQVAGGASPPILTMAQLPKL